MTQTFWIVDRQPARDHILALAIELKIEIKDILARRRVAGEADTGARRAACIAENHCLDGDRRADGIIDIIEAPILRGFRRAR